MRGDYSRLRFRPSDHYSAVRLQQGRAQLDADFNEQVDITAHRDEETTRDVIGRTGFALDGGGFELRTGHVLRGLSFHADREGFAVGEDATIVAIAPPNGGAETWTTLEAPPADVGAHLNAVHVLSAGDGWAVGDGGQLLQRTAGGWTAPSTSPTVADLHDVHSADAGTGWAVGDRGTLLKRTGTSWAAQPVQGVAVRLRGVFALTVTHAWAVGDAGTILRTTDGTAWARQQAPARTGDLHAVYFTTDGTERGWAVGDGATILRTVDGGATWERRPVPAGVTATLRAVGFRTATEGVAVGDDGTILVTADGGLKWTLKHAAPQATANLRAVDVRGAGARAAGDDLALGSDGNLDNWTPRALPAAGRTLTISAGDAYVDGVRTVNERTVSFARQPDLPGAKLPGGATGETYGAYLRVAEHHLTVAERDELREVALGGPDTTTRTQTTWQVDLAPLPGDTCLLAEAALPSAGGTGRLRARARPGQIPAGECIVPPDGGYRRLENQLYRVEVLKGGDSSGTAASAATYTWSRDNGSVVSRLVAVDHDRKTVSVAELFDDEILGLAPKQWVEISDEGRALRGQRGMVARIKSISGTVIELEDLEPHPNGAKWTMTDFPLRPTVRRWDGIGTVKQAWEALEEGIEVDFAGGQYKPGDFWTIPARTLSGDIEWRRSGFTPLFEQHEGARVRFASLAVVRRDAAGGWTVRRDCRRRFPPLAGLITLHYAGGDGQEVKTDLTNTAQRTRLPAPLEARVSNGRHPVPNATVRFRCVAPPAGGPPADGRLSSDLPGTQPGAPATEIVVTTGANGLARATWDIAGGVQVQHVEATLLLDEDSPPLQPSIRFTAQRSIAAEVAYDPGGCQNMAAAKDVQAAIVHLAERVAIDWIGGDAQEVLAAGDVDDVQLRVVNACGPLANATIAFATANGTVTPRDGGATNAQGVAACGWTLDAGLLDTQYLEATVTHVGATAISATPLPMVRFSANLSRADHVAYKAKDACPPLSAATTVEEALDHLIADRRLEPLSPGHVQAEPGETVPVRVAVRSACGGVAGRVDFDLLAGDGTLSETAPVDAVNGVAEVTLTVGVAVRHLVRATLVDPAGAPTGVPELYFSVARSIGACTVVARPGDDLQAAVESLPAGGGELCLAAGEYLLDTPLRISRRDRILVSGRGPATILRALRTEAALQVTACVDVTVRDLRVEGHAHASSEAGDHDLDGAITFEGCTDVRVVDCELACPDAAGRDQTCLTVRPASRPEADRGPVRVEIERNRFEVGAGQLGALVVDAQRATLVRNEVRLGPAPDGVDFARVGVLAREVAKILLDRQLDAPHGSIVRFGDDVFVRMPVGSPELELVRAAAETIPLPARDAEPRQIVTRYLHQLGKSGSELQARLTPEAAKELRGIVADLRCVGQGLVVGGKRADTVQVLDNVIEGASEGIHIGVSDGAAEGTMAGDVIISRNVIRLLVPAGSRRERGAVYVANSAATTIVDTAATLTRTGGEGGEVDGIRVRGFLGRYLLVRGSRLDGGFAVGVRVQPQRLSDEEPNRMWLVAQTMASGAQQALVAPPQVVSEMNVA